MEKAGPETVSFVPKLHIYPLHLNFCQCSALITSAALSFALKGVEDTVAALSHQGLLPPLLLLQIWGLSPAISTIPNFNTEMSVLSY